MKTGFILAILLGAGAASAQTISASPSPSAGLVFSQPEGNALGFQAPAQTITVASSPTPLSLSASASTTSGGSWLAVTPSTGTTPATVQVSVNAGYLNAGTYSGTVTIAAAGASGSPITYGVTLTIAYELAFTVFPEVLQFAAIANGPTPAAQTVQTVVGYVNGYYSTVSMFFAEAVAVATTSGGNWLAASPSTGMAPGGFTVSINAAGLAVGNYSGVITVSPLVSIGVTPAFVTVSLTVSAAVTPAITAIGNAASGASSAVSPGEELAIYGANLGPATTAIAAPVTGSYATLFANTQVFFDGTLAPILAASKGQINVMAPYSISGHATTTIMVSYLGVTSSTYTYNVDSTVPGVYTVNQAGTGQGAVLNQNLTVNSASNPAAPGSVVSVYVTGEGITSPAGVTGQVAPSDGTGLNSPVQKVTATVGGIPATVLYAGAAPGLVYGVMQVNVQIPAVVAAGNAAVLITVGTVNSQPGVTVAVN